MTTALIAEDEPLLARGLRAELEKAWPGLHLSPLAEDGDAALERALAERPDVLFLDIRMPGRTGLEVAEALAEDWPADAGPLPLLVFVTAYDQHALEAFERAAADYLLKPVQPARLQACCERLRVTLAQRAAPQDDALLAKLRALLGSEARAGTEAGANPRAGAGAEGDEAPGDTGPLVILQASAGSTIHMVPVAEVLYLEAADKYVRVVTREREALVRTSLRELLPRLPADRFWQVHRGTVVRAEAIATAVRDETGKLTLTLRERDEKLAVSRLYAHRFKGM